MARARVAPPALLRRALSQRPLDALLRLAPTVCAAHARRHQGGQDLGQARRRDAACGRRPRRFPVRRMTRAAAVLALACILETAARTAYAAPAEDEQQIKRGAQLLQQKCAPCHAVGKTGDSPRQEAPPFRTLSQRYPIESLEESLGEGIMSGHPDMPEFSFDAD